MSYAAVKNYQVPNGVLFIYDQGEDLIVPPDTGSEPLIATPNCLSIWTIGEYDGDVDITLASAEGHIPDGELIFSGVLSTRKKKIALNRSDTEVICEIDVPSKTTQVRVYATGFPYSRSITCLVE